ncbi:MAG: hypothetical protein KDC13_01745 [Bacteroidetes bacterium]|nr:hypothetical protein [Bacteroidota bacterium]
MKRFVPVLFAFYLSLRLMPLQAQAVPADSLANICLRLVSYIQEQQNTTDIPGFEYAGEWPSKIHFRTGFLLLNNPKHGVYDSNCFSLAGVHNILAGIYLKHPQFDEIPNMLDASAERLMTYYSNGGFNFWPLLPPGGRMYMFHRNHRNDLVRRPVQYKLYSPYIRKAANVVNDNDDTSQGLLALSLLARVKESKGESNNFHIQFSPLLSYWRDTARESQHWYNIIHFDKRESGAFLTWRALEKPFPSWNIPRLLFNNATFLLPVSTLYPEAFKPYIPYGCNDVDAVVNANVLTALAVNGEGHSKGVTDAVRFIHSKVRRKKWSRAGIYYPNRYNIHYATARAYKAGIAELEPTIELLVKHIKTTVRSDGSFRSRRIVNHGDRLQSSIYALHALLSAGNPAERQTSETIHKTMRYLIAQLRNHGEGLCVEGGVFFSGGTVIRNTMFWKSDVYSSALLLDCIVKYAELFHSSETFAKAIGTSSAHAGFH